jgi:hypothetical protein
MNENVDIVIVGGGVGGLSLVSFLEHMIMSLPPSSRTIQKKYNNILIDSFNQLGGLMRGVNFYANVWIPQTMNDIEQLLYQIPNTDARLNINNNIIPIRQSNYKRYCKMVYKRSNY